MLSNNVVGKTDAGKKEESKKRRKGMKKPNPKLRRFIG
jgi:hypothetical protein